MKQKILAVCDLEETYAFRMAEYIVEKVSLPYTLHLFTVTSDLKCFLEKNRIYILLIGEGAMRQLSKKPEVPNIFVLKESGKEMETEYHCIDKFQSPEKILREMVEQIADLDGWEAKQERAAKLKMIGIYSPVRRCLQTSFALTMGQLLAKKHKVLYLNFECYSGFSQMMRKEFSADMLDVIYYFQCAREKLTVRLSSIIQNVNGLDYIPPGASNLDMQAITGENWLELVDLFERNSDYEYLILDLTDSMSGLFDLLSQCCRIYTITKDDGFAMAKMNQYEKILQVNDLQDIAGKTVKCKFPFFEKLPADLNLMTHGELAGYVRAIIEEDLYEKQAG